MPLSLHVFEPRYRQLVADLLDDQDPRAPEFGVVALRQGSEVGDVGDVHEIGTSARVTDVLPLPDGRCDLAAVGERRFRILELHPQERPYLMATVQWLPEPAGQLSDTAVAATRRAVARYDEALQALQVSFEQPDLEPSEDAAGDLVSGGPAWPRCRCRTGRSCWPLRTPPAGCPPRGPSCGGRPN